MTRLALTLLIGLCAAPGLFAQSPVDGPSAVHAYGGDAQKKYDSGDFAGAAALYQQAVSASPRDAALRYDLGNALLKSGHLGPAIASYQRAFDLLPRDVDIRYNLGFALRQAGEELVPPGMPPVLFKLFYFLSERELAGLHWLGCWAALLLAAVCVRKANRREKLKPFAFAALGFWALAGAWWGARLALEPSQRGVIVKASAEIRSGPGDNFSVSFTAPEGRRVEILSQSGSWLEIGVLKEGAKGWLPADAVERI